MKNNGKTTSGHQRLSTLTILWMLILAGLVGLLMYTPGAEAAGLDYVIIRDAPGGGGNIVGNRDYSVGDSDTFYCAGYNYTSGYTGDVEVYWYSTNSNVGAVNPTSNSNWTEFHTLSGGVAQVHVYLPGGPYNTTGDLAVYTPVDYILIRDAPDGGGQWVGDQEYYAPSADFYYAAGYNDTNGYLGDINVNWYSTNTSVGNVNTSYGSSITFFTFGSGFAYVKAYTYNGPNQIYNYTGKLNVTVLPLDYIMIRDAPNGGGNPIIEMNYTLGESDLFYCAGYNHTTGYLRDFQAYWVSHNQDVGDVYPYEFSNWTEFKTYAGGVAVVHAYVLGGRYNTTGNLTVFSPIDFIIIRDAPDGGGQPVGNRSYFVGDSDTFYAAGYNYTTGYWGDVRVHWYSTNNEAGVLNPTSKSNWTVFQTMAGGVAQVHLYVIDGPYNTTGNLVVYTPIDFIIIRDAPDGGGQWVGDREYFVSNNETFYAAGYNDTTGYLGDVKVHWYVINISVGTLSTYHNNKTTFTAKNAGYTYLRAYTYNGPNLIENYTGRLNVTVAPIDYIIIRDQAEGEGEWVGDMTYWEYDTDIYHAAGYNNTHYYQGDFNVNWTSSDTGVCTVSPQGESTLLTAVGNGTCSITAQYYGLTNATGIITVFPVITVDDSGGADFLTIQEAIDAASPGDRIYVFNGTYDEHVIVNKTVSIKGENKYETKIDGNGTGTVVLITADNVSLQQFIVQNGHYGIYADNVTSTVILNNFIKTYTYGIYNNYTTDSLVKYNFILNGEYGVVTYYAYDDAFRYNVIANNTEYGAKGYNSQLKNCFNWNYFVNNTVAYWYDPTLPLTELEFDGNILENNYIGVKVSDASTVRITNNTISGGEYGIYVINGSPRIYGNTIENYRIGIYLANSNSKLEKNSITGSDYGIITYDSSPIITMNDIEPALVNTILIENAQTAEITNNTAADITIYNSTIATLVTTDTEIILVNSAIENISMEGDSTLTAKWFLDVKVEDSEGLAVEGAAVTILDYFGNEVEILQTGPDGLTVPAVLTEYIIDSQGQTYYTPHTVMAEKGEAKGEVKVRVNENKVSTVAIKVPEPIVTTTDYDDAWKSSDFTITLQSTGGEGGIKAVFYRVNGGSLMSVSSDGHPLITTEGDDNTLEFWAEDNEGNVETHRFLNGIKLDKSIPEVTMTTESMLTVSGDFIIEARVTDDHLDDSSVVVWLDSDALLPMAGSPTGEFTVTVDTSTLSAGGHIAKILARDLAGNQNSTEYILFITTAPEPLLTTAIYDDTWKTGDFTITLQSAGGEGGIKAVFYRVNGGNLMSVSSDGHPLITTEGDDNTLEFWAEDISGNVEPHRFRNGIKLDKSMPEVAMITDSGITASGEFGMEVRVTDEYLNNSNVMFQVDGGALQPMSQSTGDVFTAVIDTSTLTEGEHTVRIYAYDLAGNLNDAETLTFTTAVSSPVVSGGFPWVIFLVVIGSVTLLGVGGIYATEVGKYALISLFLPLYMKLRQDDMIDHYVRGKIYQYLELNPGEHYNSIKKTLGLNNGSLTHHLHMMEKANIIKSRQDGMLKRFYPYETRIPEFNGGVLSEIQKRIVGAVRDLPGVTQKELASVLGVHQSTLSYQLAKLEESGKISASKKGRKTCYRIKE